MQAVINDYYNNNAKKLHRMVERVLIKEFGKKINIDIPNKDIDDYYSIANMVFCDIIKTFDKTKNFEVYLYSTLTNKFKSHFTYMNREKREGQSYALSIDSMVDNEEGISFKELIADSYDIENDLLEKNNQYDEDIEKYLNVLSKKEREVLEFKANGYKPHEIQKLMKITPAEYNECLKGIMSCRNFELLNILRKKWEVC